MTLESGAPAAGRADMGLPGRCGQGCILTVRPAGRAPVAGNAPPRPLAGNWEQPREWRAPKAHLCCPLVCILGTALSGGRRSAARRAGSQVWPPVPWERLAGGCSLRCPWHRAWHSRSQPPLAHPYLCLPDASPSRPPFPDDLSFEPEQHTQARVQRVYFAVKEAAEEPSPGPGREQEDRPPGPWSG